MDKAPPLGGGGGEVTSIPFYSLNYHIFMKTRLTSLYIILGIASATCTAQVNSQPQRRIFSGGHELYYEYRANTDDIGCNWAGFALKADKDIPKQEPENGYIYEQKLWRLIDMPETNYGEYVLVEGSHCSCYDFDDTKWEATVYTREELKKLLENVDVEVDPLRAKLKNFIKLNL